MLKKLVLAAILVIPTMGISNLAVAGVPFPGCYPCPPQPNPTATMTAVVPVDAR